MNSRLGLSILFLIPGCVRYHPDPLDPQSELAALRARTPEVVIRDSSPATRPTTRPFNLADGLDEPELIAIALTLNPALSARRYNVGLARAGRIAAGELPNPEIGLDLRPGVSGTPGPVFEADLLFELLRTSQRQARRDSAQAKITTAVAELLADELQLAGRVRQAHLSILAAEQSLILLQEELVLRQRALDLVRQRRKIGEGNDLDISTAELEHAEVAREWRAAREDVEQSRRALNALLGLPPQYSLKFSASGKPLRVTVYSDIPDDALDRRLLASRPELRAAEAKYQQSEADLRLAIAKQYPNLKLGPSVGRELEGDWTVGLGVALELPIFNRNRGEIAERIVERRQARATYIALMHELRSEAHIARAAVRRAREEVDIHDKQILPLVQRNQDLIENAFRAREVSVAEWVTAQQRALRARREYLSTLTNYGKALIELEIALGQSAH